MLKLEDDEDELANLSQFCVRWVSVFHDLESFFRLADSTVGQVFRGGQVFAALRHPQAQAHQGQVLDLCQRHRPRVPRQAVPREVRHQVGRLERGTAVQLSVRRFLALLAASAALIVPLCRYHAVQEFNRGVFDYLIATDESGLEGHDRDTNEEEEKDGEASGCA